MFTPRFTPSGAYAARIARNARTCARESAISSSSSRSSKLGDVAHRRDQQVPGAVRVEVHHRDRLRRALEHECLGVVGRGRRGCTSRTRCRCARCSGPTRTRDRQPAQQASARRLIAGYARWLLMRARAPRRRAARRTSSTGDVALGVVAPPPVHADGAVLDVGVADHEHVRHLLGLGPPDARAERAVRAVEHLDAEARRPSAGRRPRSA